MVDRLADGVVPVADDDDELVGSIHAPRDVQISGSRLQQNIRILQEDLEDFKTKLSILEGRLQATLDLVSSDSAIIPLTKSLLA